MLYLTESDVRRFLPMAECIDLMQKAFQALESGEAVNQPRRRLILPAQSVLHYMAAASGPYFGAKIYSSNPRHGAHFLLLLYRSEDAKPLAILEANWLGRIRTGAVTGLATRLLARPDSGTVGVVGSGFQARSQLEAIAAAIHVKRAVVWSRALEKRTAFARECAAALGFPVDAAESAEQAVRGVDVLVTATNAATPVIEADWVAPGTHVNAVGSNQAQRRELPAELVNRVNLVAVDSREQAGMESGDLLMALDVSGWERVVELKDVVSGRLGRRHPEDITLFKSNGLAVEDVTAAGLIYERAVTSGAGKEFYS